MKTEEYIARGNKVIMPTYKRFPIVFDHGEGCFLTDIEGKKYLDCVGGIAVNCLGYNHSGLNHVIAEQSKKMLHISNLYWNVPMITAAEKLVKLSGLDKAFFCNSGAEANEAAIKLARIYAKLFKSEESTEIIAMKDSFHGRTYAALTATGQPKYQKNLDPLVPNITHVPFNDFEALKKAAEETNCAAILLEPVQGEGGVYPADKEYLKKVRDLCDQLNIVLIFDEVQCGIGRTGTFFAYQQYGIKPDVVAFAKGIAGGIPMGGILACDRVAQVFTPGTHASTFGANPLATSAANYVLDTVGSPEFLEEVTKKSQYFISKLKKIKGENSHIKDIRGLGLMIGVEIDEEPAKVIQKCIQSGLLVCSAGHSTIRFVPPLIITKEEIDQATEIFAKSL
jgi:acetylornithine/N-succinyldiaminopimelate aminotransferase